MLLVLWLRSVFGDPIVVQGPSIEIGPEDNPTSEVDPTAIVLHRSLFQFSGPIQSDDLRGWRSI